MRVRAHTRAAHLPAWPKHIPPMLWHRVAPLFSAKMICLIDGFSSRSPAV
ncbi:hypothetical protein BMA10247_A0224 [Burkholderia mallei NCTC 10247]|uniref:Uncharacterized protein n=1 Tax=Burkholderia mallei (strain NCTC 10229) TaxID=412022 RepID=A2S095_BURM9|nr:hypothetical protein BMA10229_1564 [Burkholderia mallei NCTC 10229]ABO02459.1 hypothetical protein BMA10247_A0224 [Burkholderia mallei NCTC 10247]